jgi:hypothetical protein
MFFGNLNFNSKSNRLEDIDQQNTITTIHIKIKIVGKHMLDKFLTGENVELNGEIAGRRHITKKEDIAMKNLTKQ